MKSFALPITTASELPKAIAQHLITQDRRKFHRSIADFDVELCQDCNKPLDREIDEINGLELVCNNPDCPGRYNNGL